MTKLKNTKKGMAKKALSISLVAAMLATSNVPVWAAEDLFSDGSVAVEAEAPVDDVDVFTQTPAEDVAPIAEEVDDNVALYADAITNSDIDVSGVTLSVNGTDVKGKTATFLDTITIGGSITKKADGTALQDFEYGWRVQGEDTSICTGNVTGGTTSAMGITLTNVASTVDWSKYVGKTLELYIFREDAAAKFYNVVVASVKVAPYDLSSWSLLLDTDTSTKKPVYNGHVYTYGDTTSIGSGDTNTITIAGLAQPDTTSPATGWDKTGVESYFTVSPTQTALNAGEKLIITATPKAGSPYTGTLTATAEISAKPYRLGDIVADLSTPLTYQYTGKKIAVPADKIALKEKPDTYANAAITNSAIEEAYVAPKTSGSDVAEADDKQNVVVKVDAKKINNFTLATTDTTLTTASTNKVNVEKRDLSATSTAIRMKYGKIPADTKPEEIGQYLTFTGKESGTPNLVLGQGKDYTIKVTNSDNNVVNDGTELKSGTYSVAVTAPSTSANTTNGQTIEITVGDNVIQSVSYTENYKPAYTGSAIEPTTANLGSLEIIDEKYGSGKELVISKNDYKIVSYDKNIEAATYDEKGTALTWSTVTVEILPSAGSYVGQTFTLPFEIQPLKVDDTSVTVPKTISYNNANSAANDYKVPLVVTAKDKSGAIVKGLTEKDYTVEYTYDDKAPNTDGKTGNEIGNYIISKITVTNPNFVGPNGANRVITLTNKTQIVAKALTDSMVQVNPSSYTYTGANITPEFVVLDGTTVLYDKAEYGSKGEYEVVGISSNLNVGTGKVTVKGVNDLYSGTASGTFQITAADTQSVKVEVKNQDYTGKQVRPRIGEMTVTLNGNDVTKQFEIVSYGENIKAGTGTVVLKPVDGNKNFTGTNVTAEFNIVKETVTGDIAVYDKNGKNITTDYTANEAGTSFTGKAFEFDGTEVKFDTAKLNLAAGTKATVNDFEIKYADNISGKKTKLANGKDTFNVGYVYAVAKDGTGYAGNKTLTLSDGSQIKNVVAYMTFAIKNVHFVDQNVTVKNGVYAGGLPVKPQVLVQIKGNTLVEGKDYVLKLEGDTTDNHYINVTNTNIFDVTVIGKGGYEGSTSVKTAWGIDKKDIKDCDVKVTNGVTTVMNGYIPVPTTEYTSKDNGDGTYTVSANTASKSYTGSTTVKTEGQKPDDKPVAPFIQQVNVVGNKATVVLAGDTEGSTGYDYVISKSNVFSDKASRVGVNANVLSTQTTFRYVDQGVYYAYLHSWKRGADGKKIFSAWSNAYPFVVSSITPDQPTVTSVKVTGKTVKVTYTKAANATGYDLVLGSKVKKVYGEMRPVEYGKFVKKVSKGNVVTATFTNVPKGTYYAGLHAYNRTSENNGKVFSPWSNTKKVTVK
ncbi:hypothetical protein NXH76_14955 [Blautia schinkii]|nr:hypothetical protein [Blautia schinkii]